MDFSSNIKASLLHRDEHLQSLRKRNKTLIFIFFSLIVLLALIIGGMIISLVLKNNSQSRSPNPSPAIREFCSVSDSQFSCINSLSSAIKTPHTTSPNQIFSLSLRASVKHLSDIVSMASNVTRPEPAFANCLSSLVHAAGQLNNILDLIRIDPDLERRTDEEGRDMTEWINVAADDLARCVRDLWKVKSTALDGAMEVAEWVRYSKDFLGNCDYVNESFRYASADDRSSRNRIVEDLMTVSLFGSQYSVLVLLFCLLMRIY